MVFSLLSVGYNPYIPWDTSLFEEGIAILRSNFGSAINIGFWIFLGISGIYLMIKLVSSIGQ